MSAAFGWKNTRLAVVTHRNLVVAMAPRFAWLALGLTTSGAMKCPGSASWVHASAQVEAIADTSCKEVMEEIKARVAGSLAGSWHDPHNDGEYSLLKAS